MPSTKSPTSLQIGPGRLSANVVSASALTSPPPRVNTVTDSDVSIVAVQKTTTLTRTSSQMFVLVDSRSFIQTVGGALLVDGQTFTLNDGVNATTTFEFNSSGGVSGGRVAVPFTAGDSANDVAASIAVAIQGVGAGLAITPMSQGNATILLVNDNFYKSITVTEAVANAGFIFRGTATAFTITLPSDPEVGDIVTFVEAAPSLVNVSIDGSGDSPIHDSSLLERLGSPYGSRSFVHSGPNNGWTATSEKPSIQTVNAATTLVRSGTSHMVLADTSTALFSITLPANCLVGDVVTVIQTVGTNGLIVDGAGADTIDGFSQVPLAGVGCFKSFLCVDAGLAWRVLQESPVTVEITDNFSVSDGLGRDVVVLVHTASAGWTSGDAVYLPSNPRPGDRVTVIDVGGSTYPPDALVVSAGVGTINGIPGSTQFAVYEGVTFRHLSGGNWFIESQSHYTQAQIEVSNTVVLTRLAGFFTVFVDTQSGTWADSDTITLPSTAIVGDIVVVADRTGDLTTDLNNSGGGHITVIPSAGTINGVSTYVVGGGYGSAAFQYSRSDAWVTINEGRPYNSVITLGTTSVTLTRLGPDTLVRVSPGGVWSSANTITLPSNAIVGDRITVCQVNTGEVSDQIRVLRNGSDTINGYLTEYAIPISVGTVGNSNKSGFATFLRIDATTWVVEKHSGLNEVITVTDDTNLTRTSSNMAVRVSTASGTWNSTTDRVTLPSVTTGGATAGDRITIYDGSGQAHLSTKSIIVDGGTIDGLSTFTINWAYGGVTFVLDLANTWTACGYGGPGRLLARYFFEAGTAPHPPVLPTPSSTQNLNPRTKTFKVRGQGPGGGATGADGQGADKIGMGSPGSSGAYFEHTFTVVSGATSFTYTVGLGGAGREGNSSSDDGTAATQVTYNAITVGGGFGLGGIGGENALNRPSPAINPAVIQPGGAVIGSPDISVPGQHGTAGFTFDNFSGTTGIGGASVMGLPGAPRVANTGAAVVLHGFPGTLGAGGSPGIVAGDVAPVFGGGGGGGILIVEEYS